MIVIYIIIFSVLMLVINLKIYRQTKKMHEYTLYVLNEWTAHTITRIREELNSCRKQQD